MKKTVLTFLLTALTLMGAGAQNIKLPAPKTEGGMPLMEALSKRASNRAFTNKTTLSNLELSCLLWAACGYNRADKRTIPTALNKQEISLYAVTPQAIYRYNAKDNTLELVVRGDKRSGFARQDYARTANLNIAIVADLALQESEPMACVAAGAASQNMYLWCAQQGYKTVVRASFDQDFMRKALGLTDKQKVLLVQTVGD